MMQFDKVEVIDKISAEIVFSSGDEMQICQALVSLAFHESDWLWVQNHCLKFLQSDNANIAGISATCLGHIARIHRKLEKDKVITALRQKLHNSEIAGVVEDALDDISIFL
jgi:hypothetical protein